MLNINDCMESQCYIFNSYKISLQCSARERIQQRHVPSTAILHQPWILGPFLSASHFSSAYLQICVPLPGHVKVIDGKLVSLQGTDLTRLQRPHLTAQPAPHEGMTVLLLRAPVSCSSRPVAAKCRCSQPFGYAKPPLAGRAQ